MLKTVWKSLLFLIVWVLLSGVFYLWLELETSSTLHHKWWVHALIGLASWIWAFSKADEAKGQSGIYNVDDIRSLALLSEPEIHQAIRVATVRQSGNEERVVLVGTRAEALDIMASTFRRKKTDIARVWVNKPKKLDVRIAYYHGRGTKEGKVIRGVTLKLINASTS